MTTDFSFSHNLSHLLQRNPQTRGINGKMHFASHTSGEEAYHTLESILKSDDDLLLTTGCGLPHSPHDVPLRYPSMIVPGLEFLRQYRAKLNPARSIAYDVYQASPFIQRVNHISDPGTSVFMQHYLAGFVDKFYPDLAPHVTFNFQKDVTSDALEPVKQFLLRHKEEKTTRHLNTIKHYQTKETRRGDNLLYTAANIHFNTHRDTSFAKPTNILPIGGLKEEPFFYLSSLYHQAEGQRNVTVLPLCYKAQENPSFFPRGTKDVTIGTLFAEGRNALNRINAETANNPAFKDFNALLAPLNITPAALYDVVEPILDKILTYR